VSKRTTIFVLGVLAFFLIAVGGIYASGPSTVRECREPTFDMPRPTVVCARFPSYWVYRDTSAWERFKLAITGD
jgi:hypothetical protein